MVSLKPCGKRILLVNQNSGGLLAARTQTLSKKKVFFPAQQFPKSADKYEYMGELKCTKSAGPYYRCNDQAVKVARSMRPLPRPACQAKGLVSEYLTGAERPRGVILECLDGIDRMIKISRFLHPQKHCVFIDHNLKSDTCSQGELASSTYHYAYTFHHDFELIQANMNALRNLARQSPLDSVKASRFVRVLSTRFSNMHRSRADEHEHGVRLRQYFLNAAKAYLNQYKDFLHSIKPSLLPRDMHKIERMLQLL